MTPIEELGAYLPSPAEEIALFSHLTVEWIAHLDGPDEAFVVFWTDMNLPIRDLDGDGWHDLDGSDMMRIRNGLTRYKEDNPDSRIAGFIIRNKRGIVPPESARRSDIS